MQCCGNCKGTNSLTVKEVSKILGVCRQTLRSWEGKGKLVPSRDSNNYRYYKKEDIDNYLRENDKALTDKYRFYNKEDIANFLKSLDQPKCE